MKGGPERWTRESTRAKGKAEPREVYVFLFILRGEQILYPFMENNEKYLLEKIDDTRGTEGNCRKNVTN